MRRLLITRTEPGATALARFLEAKGCRSVVAPVLSVLPLAPWQADVDGVAISAERFAGQPPPALVVALSAHAVRAFTATGLLPTISNVPCVAVGGHTAEQLRRLGLHVQTPAESTSEGILTMPALAQLAPGATVWLLAGRGGRDLVRQYLRGEKGVRVVKLELYQRQRVAMQPFPADSIDAALVGSEEGLTEFAQQWRARQGDSATALIVPSERVARAARRLGFTCVTVSGGMDADAVWSAVKSLDDGCAPG